jgi:hypothetical protein
MPGTFVIDAGATFTSTLLLSSSPKREFGAAEGVQAKNGAGVPKWAVEVAVTFAPAFEGQQPVSEILSVTVPAAGDPAMGMTPGTPVTLEGFRAGLTAPEKRDDGRIRGGKLWYSATGLRSFSATRAKSDAA